MVNLVTETPEQLISAYSDTSTIYEAAKIQFDIADFNFYFAETKLVNYMTRNNLKTLVIDNFTYIVVDGRLVKSTLLQP